MTYTCGRCGWTGEVNGRARCLVCYRVAVAAWRKANPEKAREQRRRGEHRARTERRDEYNAKRRRRRSADSNAAARARRIAWLLSGDVEREELISIYERDRVCVYCGAAVRPRFTPSDPRGFDHVISRASGGKHTASNLVVSCGKCNAAKG